MTVVMQMSGRSAVRQQQELGHAPGQPVLSATGPAPVLGSGREVLPSLEEVASAPRPMWKHPAFIVSMILTIVALLAAAALIILSVINPGSGEVTKASINESGGNVQLSWKANGPVELFVVTNEQALDITQLVSGDKEAWVPAALGLYTKSSCFVVRPAGGSHEQVSIDGAVLAKQKAASVCMGDGVPSDGAPSE